MAMATYHSTRKSYVYNFFPVKAEEERSPPMDTAHSFNALGHRINRGLVEIRDVHPPPVFNPHHPWQIKKSLNSYEVASGKIIVSFQDTFEHILRYWNYYMARHVTMFGRKISVIVWDVTNERNPRKYEGGDVFFQMTPSEHCLLTCPDVIKDRGMKADDFIGLYWEPVEAIFRLKLFSFGGR